MIAMQLTHPELSRRPLPQRFTGAPRSEIERAGTTERATVTAPFQPIDPDVVSPAIPAFFIGRNQNGFWVARDAGGRIGGIFLLANSALAFARQNSEPEGCAMIFPSHRFELDLENSGNPLIPYLGWLRRLAVLARQRTAALLGSRAAGPKEFRHDDVDAR